MTNRELISLLNKFPLDYEVWMEVRGQEGLVKDVDIEVGGANAWLLLTDYPDETHQ